MDFILLVASIAGVLTLGIAIGALFAATIRKDAKDAADEFTSAKNSVLAEAESIVTRLRNTEQAVIAKAQEIKKVL